MDKYFEPIESYMLDEKQIVTYKWLSRKLGIHTNLAKRILSQYIEDSERRNKCLVTYLVIGVTSGNISVVIVKQDELSTIKQKFDKVLGEHVYSLQIKESEVNLQTLYLADTLADVTLNDNKLRSIIYDRDNRTKVENVADDRTNSDSKTQDAEKIRSVSGDKIDGSLKLTSVSTNIQSNSTVMKREERKTNSKISVKERNGAKGALFGMWEKHQTKKSAEKVSISENTKATNDDDASDTKASAVKSHFNAMDSSKSLNKDTTKHDVSKESKTKTVKKEKKQERKKLKRVVLFSDSESDNETEHSEGSRYCLDSQEFQEQENEESSKQIECAEEHEEIVNKNRRKKRKVVTTQVVGEDEYLYTKKEVVFESCSESEEEQTEQVASKSKLDVQVQKEENTKVKQQVQQKTKQPSIRNFFTKPK